MAHAHYEEELALDEIGRNIPDYHAYMLGPRPLVSPSFVSLRLERSQQRKPKP
jgi:hypothetical protein